MGTTNKIKVMQCIRQGQIGGGESHLLSLVDNLDRRKFEPVVLSFTDGPMVQKLKQSKVETHIIHTEKPFNIFKLGKVRELLKLKKIDVIHAHGTRASSNVLWAAQSLRIPVIYTVHGWSFHQNQNFLVKKMRIWSEKYLTSKSDMNISVSASNRQSGKDLINNFESVIIYNGIDQKKFSPAGVKNDIRQELGIPAGALVVLFAARFTTQKQPLTLLKSFGAALKRHPGLHLLMVGDGELKDECVEMANTLDISGHVTFQPFRQDVPDLMAAADIFVLPSLWEGLPIALLEAMAMGKAVIATSVDGTKEVIEEGENGLLIEVGSANALTDALLTLAKDPALMKKIQQNALSTVQEKFSASYMTRHIEMVYEKIVGQ